MKKLILFPIILIGCIDENRLSKTITIDHSFSNDQIELAIQAIEDWKEATGCYKIHNSRFSNRDDVFCAPIEIGHVNLWEPNAIKRVRSIQDSNVDVGNESKIMGLSSTYYGWIIIDDESKGKEFFMNVKHEIGHYLGLSFDHTIYGELFSDNIHTNTPCDLMYKDYDEDCFSSEITEEHINSFKRQWQ